MDLSRSGWVLDPLKRFAAGQSTSPCQPVYVESRGQLLDEQVGGCAADYDGLIRISEVFEHSSMIPDTCRAFGQGR